MLKPDYYIAPTQIDLLVFDKLIADNHYLRQLKAAINFEPLRQLLSDCYSPSLGRGAEDPVRLLKLCLLEFHYRLSDREVIAQSQVNVAFRFFLDLSLDSPLPTPALLTQFRARLGVERFSKVFDEILRQARHRGLVSDRLRLKDATHVIANIAVPSTIQLVAQIRNRLLEVAQVWVPDQVAADRKRVEQIRLATADLKDEQRLLARVEHLREIVCWADRLQAQMRQGERAEDQSEPRWTSFESALALAHKVLADRQPQAQDKLVSLVDQDARTGKHGHYFDGYLLDVSMDADSELICALDVLSANGDGAANAKKLIESEESAVGNDIESLSMDSIGFRGETLRELSQEQTGPQLKVYVPPYEWPGSSPGLFKPEQFQMLERGEQLQCPAGQTTSSRTRAGRDQGWQYFSSVKQCGECKLRQHCLKAGTKRGRTVIKNVYEAQYRAARQRAESEDYKAVRQQHPRIERKLADMMRWHGGRRVRYRGRMRVKIQYLVTAVVVNFKRIDKLLSGQQQQPA